MGLSLRNIGLQVFDARTQRVIFSDFGEMLFTHFGVSGPVVLSASAHMRDMSPERYQLRIDLKPTRTIEQLDTRLLRAFAENANKQFVNVLNTLLPKRLSPVAAALSRIPPNLAVNQITREQRQTITRLLKCLAIGVTGFRPIDEAIITSGGIAVDEVQPGTMQSKHVRGLYFAGEVLDVDAYTGGFNLQIAFSTGHLAGLSAATIC
jgi:predicted Rossmann fold flavoprotein